MAIDPFQELAALAEAAESAAPAVPAAPAAEQAEAPRPSRRARRAQRQVRSMKAIYQTAYEVELRRTGNPKLARQKALEALAQAAKVYATVAPRRAARTRRAASQREAAVRGFGARLYQRLGTPVREVFAHIPKDLNQKALDYAKAQGIKKADVMRQALEEYAAAGYPPVPDLPGPYVNRSFRVPVQYAALPPGERSRLFRAALYYYLQKRGVV